jgi:hypothetical protein
VPSGSERFDHTERGLMLHDTTSADLQRIVTKQYPVTVTFDGPQEGVILPSATTTQANVVVPAYSQTVAFFGCPLPYGLADPPDPGTRCLVLFVGSGVSDPWIVALTTVPLSGASS